MAKSNGSGVGVVLYFHLESLDYIHREQSVNEKRRAGGKRLHPAWRAVCARRSVSPMAGGICVHLRDGRINPINNEHERIE
jgi:hypothetical protein